MGVKRPFEEEEFSEFPLKLSKLLDQDKKELCREDEFSAVVTSPKTDFHAEVQSDLNKLQSDGLCDKDHTNDAPVAENESETSALLPWVTSSSSEDYMGIEDPTFDSYFPADFDFSIPQRRPIQFEDPYLSFSSFSPRKDVHAGQDHPTEAMPWNLNSAENDGLDYNFTVDNHTENRSTGIPLVQMSHDSTTESFLSSPPRKEVPIGPNHQAEVLPWDVNLSGETYARSYTWEQEIMGTCIVPMPDDSAIDRGRVGQGRTDCTCLDLGSVSCVDEHVKKARETLRKTIGDDLFAELGFYDMGEEVACKWTEDEEHLFHEIIFSNPVSLGRNFWSRLSSLFPTRTKKEIVSYYFNVFMLRRRSTQNRSLLLGIDSDDDEWKGSHGNIYQNQSNSVDSDTDDDDDEDQRDDDEQDAVRNNYGNFRSSTPCSDGDHGDNQDDYNGRVRPYQEFHQVSGQEKHRGATGMDISSPASENIWG